MSNNCSSCYCFAGPKKEIFDLHKSLLDMDTTVARRTYSNIDLAEWFERLGYKAPAGSDLRSRFIEIGNITEDGNDMFHFCVDADDAWAPKDDAIAAMLRYLYPNVFVFVRAEESGCDVFVNTDPTGLFFPEQFYIDICLPRHIVDGGYECRTFNTEEECLAFFRSIGINADSIEEANQLILEIVDDDETGEAFGSIHEYHF